MPFASLGCLIRSFKDHQCTKTLAVHYPFLFDFWFQLIKFRGGEEFTQCDFQSIAQLFDGNNGDIITQYLDICRTWHIIANQPAITDTTKPAAGRRSIPIPPVLADQLRVEKSKSTSDYVAANSAGGALSGSQWRNLWTLVSKRTTQERSY